MSTEDTNIPRLPTGVASALGPMPGREVRDACAVIAGELPDLPFVPELADRGVGADPVGRTVGLLAELPAEVTPSGWRLTARPGVDQRRITDFRAWDLDAAGERFHAAPTIKVGLLGPWTLATCLELPSGHRVLADHGAVRDLTESMIEGLRGYLSELRERLGDSRILIQLDESQLPAVLAGRIPTASGYGTLRSVSAETVRASLRSLRESLADCAVAVVGVGPSAEWNLLREARIDALTCQLTDLAGAAETLDRIGEWLDADRALLVQLPSPIGEAPTATAGRKLLAGWAKLGFIQADLPERIIPLAGPVRADPSAAFTVARELAAALPDPPGSWSRER